MRLLNIFCLFLEMAYYFAYKHPYTSKVAFGPLSWLFFFLLDFCLHVFAWISYLAFYDLFIFMIL